MPLMDKTDNNLADQSARQLFENELIRLDRLNLLGEMAATVGHEVRNPMTTVRGFLQMLQMKDPSSDNNPYYNLMIEELDRANQIISEFLGIARENESDMQSGSINHILAALHPLIKAQALMKNVTLLFECEECGSVYLNEKEIRQMIINLACNGIESMASHGNLTIGTRQGETDVILFVSDQGSGIPPEILEKIRTPFFTTKEQGTGLGLPVCYNIADHHNARIEISTGPLGTTFSVYFPLANPAY